MKPIILGLIILFITLTQLAHSKTLVIDVHGMTCAFCVDSLERKFSEMKSISKVEVSLKLKQVRLEMVGETPSLDTVKQTVLDAGFTPVKITEQQDETIQK